MEILIGKEPEHGRLMVATIVNGQYKVALLGSVDSVPASVSRCRPNEGVAHCKLELLDDGKIKLTNLKEQNVTWVNGNLVMSKRIDVNSILQLGKEKFTVSIPDVIKVAEKLIPPSSKEYSIKHLEEVWNRYHDAVQDIKYEQRRIALISKAAPIFTMGGVVLSAVLSMTGHDATVAYVFTAMGLIVTVYGFIKSSKDKSLEKTEELTEKLQEEYVCPNPDCRHFVGNQPYKVLRQSKNCPYCHCKWTEDKV